MASIEKRGKCWRYRIQAGIDPQTGKYKQVSRSGFPTKRAAQLAAHEAELAISKGTYVPTSRTTFAAFAADWLRAYALHAKPSSVRIRSQSLSLLLECLGKLPLQRITTPLYEQCLHNLQQAGFAINTILGVHSVMRMVCKRAMQLHVLAADPSEYVRPPRQPATPIGGADGLPRFLERDELQRFLTAARQHGLRCDYALFSLLAFTGMRIGEALALCWDDIDLHSGMVSITKTLACPSGRARDYKLYTPKTVSSRRTVDISPDVCAVLRSWRSRWLIEKARHADDWCPEHDFVFTAATLYGYPFIHSNVQHHINRIVALLEPPIATRVTPHVFRHTHISLLAAAGVPLHEIMERVGQIDDSTTKRVYLHITKERKHAASRVFDDYMTGESL